MRNVVIAAPMSCLRLLRDDAVVENGGGAPLNLGPGMTILKYPDKYIHPLPAAEKPVAATVDASEDWLRALELTGRIPASRLLYYLVFKRWIDVTIALVLTLVCLPILVLVAAAIKLDSRGPVAFRQTRIGWNGEPFTMYKFRTMTSDRRVRQVPFVGHDRRTVHKSLDDPRVTRVGRLLRASSIDELPQLVNVLRGDMSLVGPRPELPGIVERYAAWQHDRHLVRPGMTGWWQVSGRSTLPMHEHTDLDLYYVRNLSLRLDVTILARTTRAVISRSGAF